MNDDALKSGTQDIVVDEVFPHAPETIWKTPTTGRLARAHEHGAGRLCANCSRTKCARSAANSVCRRPLSRRHPFPGPGLTIRCPGEVTREKLEILRRADDIYIQEIRRAGLYVEIWQAFAVLLPVRTVGVMGDFRTYDYVVGLRAVTSTDGMTADFYPFDMKFIGHVATRIVNEVKGVGRACDGLFLCPCELRFTAPPRSQRRVVRLG